MIAFANTALAKSFQHPEPDWLLQMYENGWHKVQKGVLRRDVGGGRFETFGYGAEGYQWLLQRYVKRLAFFESMHRQAPTDDLAAAINALTNKIHRVQNAMMKAPTADRFAGEAYNAACTSFNSTLAADALTSELGITASASAYFHSTCGETADVFTLAYAHAINGTVETTKTQTDTQNGVTWADSFVSATALGAEGCESEAEASIINESLGILHVPPPATHSGCPDKVSISGPVQVDYYGAQCTDVTWTASTLSGRTDYNFEWFIGTISQGTGLTLTKHYCNESKDETVRVVVNDSAVFPNDASFTTRIRYTSALTVSITGPTTVNIDSYSPCATVTWTASAANGHPGYTYTWYLDPNSTAQGTGTTFSKQYCNSSQTVAVRVVARDSDGHTAEKTHTTNIVYQPGLAVSVDGPPIATVDYYGATCATVTWTATPTNGHPGYTYAWYINYDPKRSNTIQGTGSTLTQSYCTTSQSFDAMVVVTDSDGHTATATSTTNFTYKRQIVPTISGPATVSTNTTTPCADVTWTASATGTGHSPFTYKWYFGTTLQGSGSTFTKRYCSTSATVNVKLVATGSDGHSANTTFTTTITYTSTPPLSASISGPAEVTLYSSTQCLSVTWTAKVSGGTPAYSYSWTIGTSTTVLSTTSSLTKTVCNEGAVTAKLTVRDSAAKTASVSFITEVYEDVYCLIGCP